ncbi:MAG: imidazole glycerol phosphate synthase subunit HisH, partial [Pseudomonadota bacterium]
MVSTVIKSQSVVVVDYGSGNLRSVAQALKAVADSHTTITISNNPAVIKAAHRVVLPGQGAMPDCMRHLHTSGLLEAVVDAANNKPLMGICVGQQMLLDSSTESNMPHTLTPALGLIAGQVIRFASNLIDTHGNRLKVPHMGWNQVFHSISNNAPHAIFSGIPSGERFYFVHSYYAQPTDKAHNLATTDYGITPCVVVGRDNLIGLQFHPEKSSTAG